MNANSIRQTLKCNEIKFKEELGHSCFNYTRFSFSDRQTAMKVEKILHTRITRRLDRFCIVAY